MNISEAPVWELEEFLERLGYKTEKFSTYDDEQYRDLFHGVEAKKNNKVSFEFTYDPEEEHWTAEGCIKVNSEREEIIKEYWDKNVNFSKVENFVEEVEAKVK